MANVHRLSDLEQPRTITNYSAYSVQDGGRDPADVKCIDMFFPQFTTKSFLLWISAVQCVIYFATLVYGSSQLRPNGSTLMHFGAEYGPLIAQGQVWRFVTPMFLHASIGHIALNVLCQLRIGFPMEAQYGVKRVALVYMASGIAGNIFAAATHFCVMGIGASVAGFGLIGVQIAELALLWHVSQRRDQVIFNLVLWFGIVLLMSLSPGSNIDWRGHLGGFIAGFGMGVILNKEMESPPSWLKMGVTVAIAVIAVEYLASLLAVFLLPHQC